MPSDISNYNYFGLQDPDFNDGFEHWKPEEINAREDGAAETQQNIINGKLWLKLHATTDATDFSVTAVTQGTKIHTAKETNNDYKLCGYNVAGSEAPIDAIFVTRNNTAKWSNLFFYAGVKMINAEVIVPVGDIVASIGVAFNWQFEYYNYDDGKYYWSDFHNPDSFYGSRNDGTSVSGITSDIPMNSQTWVWYLNRWEKWTWFEEHQQSKWYSDVIINPLGKYAERVDAGIWQYVRINMGEYATDIFNMANEWVANQYVLNAYTALALRGISIYIEGANVDAETEVDFANFVTGQGDNDAGKGCDAGNDFYSSTLITIGTYTGELCRPFDKEDWYGFHVESSQTIYASVTPPAAVNFDLELYDPYGFFAAGSYVSSGQTDDFYYNARLSGYWRIRTYIEEGGGQYYLYLSLLWPGGSGGACPFVSAWNGSNYALDNNLLPASEFSGDSDVLDYYALQQPLLPRDDGSHSLLLSEFENEHDFFDQVQLIAVDHSSVTKIGVSPYGEILTYTNPSPAAAAIDDDHQNIKQLLDSIDGNYYEAHNGSHVTLNFGDLNVTQGAKLVIRSDPYLKSPIYIQTTNSTDQWQTVAVIYTRTSWSTDIINLSQHLPDAKGNLKVRLRFVSNDRIDFIGLDTSPQAAIQVVQGQLVSAIHASDGDVTAQLLHSDDTYAELTPGPTIRLTFTLTPQTMEERNYVIIAEGHYYTITSENP